MVLYTPVSLTRSYMDIKRIEAFFFEAMQEGWATPAKKMPIAGLPGAKSIPFKKGDLSLLDYYLVNPDNQSSYGTTVIWLAEKPVWVMHYGGFYSKSVIPFLKRALQHTYSRTNFIGGRGPEEYREVGNNLIYQNKPNYTEFGFACFSGREVVFSTEDLNATLGEHRYFGGMF